jgi:hypothetical protein
MKPPTNTDNSPSQTDDTPAQISDVMRALDTWIIKNIPIPKKGVREDLMRERTGAYMEASKLLSSGAFEVPMASTLGNKKCLDNYLQSLYDKAKEKFDAQQSCYLGEGTGERTYMGTNSHRTSDSSWAKK